MSPWSRFYASSLMAAGWSRWAAELEAESIEWWTNAV
jgi:hypothetical protein